MTEQIRDRDEGAEKAGHPEPGPERIDGFWVCRRVKRSEEKNENSSQEGQQPKILNP